MYKIESKSKNVLMYFTTYKEATFYSKLFKLKIKSVH